MVCNHLFLCLFGISACFIADSVAREAIIGGQEVKNHTFPYLVSVQTRLRVMSNSLRHVCGGAILSDYHILTAAYCVYPKNLRFRNNVTIVAGTNDMSDNKAVIRHAKKIFVPNEYKPPKFLVSDICVLKLEQPLELEKHTHLQVLKLPKNYRVNDDGKVAIFAGWGWTWIHSDINETITGGRNDTHSRFVVAHVLKNSQCQEVYYPLRNISKNELCARVVQTDDYFTTSGASQGDEGGPLVYDDTVIGVLSINPKGISEILPAAIYSRVSRYLNFIDNAMSNVVTNYMRVHTIHN